MNNLELVKSERFGEIECDFYSDNKDIYVTRTQIGKALEYPNPSRAISDIHKKHKERLDRFSRVTKISLPYGGTQDVYIYNTKGIYEICRHSNQPKADAFYDWVYDILESLRKGENKIIKTTEYQKLTAEAKLNNSRARMASVLMKIANNTQIPEYKQVCCSYASAVIAGKPIIPLPEVNKKTYSATEIGDMLGVTANRIGILANKNNMKTKEYGKKFYDKSRYSNKEVETFRYYENAISKFKELV